MYHRTSTWDPILHVSEFHLGVGHLGTWLPRSQVIADVSDLGTVL